MLMNKPQRGVWLYGVLWLVFLAPFFFLTYGFANQYASGLSDVPAIVFAWEQHIPLWTWTILPYWSIDLFYGLSLLLCFSKHELRQQVLRLISAQVIAVSCFLLFPLRFTFERPELSGFFAVWFDILMGFDKPFNQAPSLHIILLVILWDFYRRHVTAKWRWLVHVWSLLIGISVLTTWQHHFIDIPTGILVGALCLWLFPLEGFSPLRIGRQSFTYKHLKLAVFYLVVAVILTMIALLLQAWALWLFYPAVSFLLLALGYILRQPTVFQKQPDGRFTVASRMLFAPYILLAWINSRLWTRKHPEDCLILEYNHFEHNNLEHSNLLEYNRVEIYLGRIPTQQHASRYQGLFDCCAELPHHKVEHQSYEAFYSLDLIPIQHQQFSEAVARLDHLLRHLAQQNKTQQQTQKVLIYCALGYSRSCSILIAWLIDQGIVTTAQQGLDLVQQQRPWVVLKPAHLLELEQWQQQYESRHVSA